MPAGFWEQHGDKILVAVATAIIVLILSETIKALLKKLGTGIDRALQSFGWRFRKRYLRALTENHRWLRLIGFYHRAELHPPRLQEVYVALRLATAQADASPRVPWNEIFTKAEKRLVILGPPGSGKSTLIDYLILVFTGHVRHPLRDQLGRCGAAAASSFSTASTRCSTPTAISKRSRKSGNSFTSIPTTDSEAPDAGHGWQG
jgi:hypothetical protein